MPSTQPELHVTHSSSLLVSPRQASRGLSPRSRLQSISSLESPYPVGSNSGIASISHRLNLPVDLRQWGSNLYADAEEPDDDLHDPDVRTSRTCPSFADRGVVNVGCLCVIVISLVTLFAGYPMISYFNAKKNSTNGAFGLGGTNASGQVPVIAGNWGLIDLDTPKDAYTKPSWNGGPDMELVFSDEFNTDGRTFWSGDDPHWEATDLHYWPTNNLEWYHPDAAITHDGSLVVTLSQKQTHGLNYQSGMITTWNKFCFTGGYVEANVSLPGMNNVVGYWPAIWTLGALGRAGYGASLEGLWPYSYDTCDIGTVANQSINGQPVAATEGGDVGKGESHPGPKHSDGTFVGRSAPEIDLFEGQVSGTPLMGQVSQSAQWAPFNAAYAWRNTSVNEVITNSSISIQNTYTGSVLQQATSVVTQTDQGCYEGESGCYSIYGFEYQTGFDDAYITWVSDNKVAWTLRAAGMGPDPAVQISSRPVPREPMYLIINLGMSYNFGPVDLEHLIFPAHMRVDYIRVYQPLHARNIGCDPKDHPTAEYINSHIKAYTNPNLTTWRGDYGQPFPKNRFLGEC